MAFNFKPSLIPTLAAVAAVAATIALGNWQSGRAAEKQALQDQLLARRTLPPVVLGVPKFSDEWMFRQGKAQGEYLEGKLIFLDNKSLGSRVGVHVVAPLKVSGTGDVVLVNLGWMARPASYPAMPKLDLPKGLQSVDGLLVPPIRRFLELKDETAQGNLWQNLTIDRAQAALALPVYPALLQLRPAAPGLEPVTELPDAGIDKHRGYAFQWYSLATLVTLLWLGLNLRKARST
jgi:surfeit locus 1 family protein